MTCIVAITDGRTVYMGGDSAGVAGYSINRRKDQKVGKVGKFLFGFAGSFRLGQILLHDFKPPKIRGKDLYRYMVSDFTKALRKALKDRGSAYTIHGEDSIGGLFLVGIRGRLFCVESDYQIGELDCDYHAIGCGSDIALGSLFSSIGRDHIERVYLALEAATEFSAGVCAPYVIESNK